MPKSESQATADVQKAIVKFNGGRGALLCNQCHRVLATGYDHQDRQHFCREYGLTCAAGDQAE